MLEEIADILECIKESNDNLAAHVAEMDEVLEQVATLVPEVRAILAKCQPQEVSCTAN